MINGVLTVNLPVVEFHSLIPNVEASVSIQYVPFTGVPLGSVASGASCHKFTSARTT